MVATKENLMKEQHAVKKEFTTVQNTVNTFEEITAKLMFQY